MGDDNKDLVAKMKAGLEAFSTDLTKNMDKVQECLVNVNNYLIAMEHSGYSTTKEDANVVALAKAKPDHSGIAKALKDKSNVLWMLQDAHSSRIRWRAPSLW